MHILLLFFITPKGSTTIITKNIATSVLAVLAAHVKWSWQLHSVCNKLSVLHDKTLHRWPLHTTVSLVLQWLFNLAQYNMTTADAKRLVTFQPTLNTPVAANQQLQFAKCLSTCQVCSVSSEFAAISTNSTREQQLVKWLPFSALTLLVGWQEVHLACKKTERWFVGGDILTGALHISSSSCYHHFHHP